MILTKDQIKRIIESYFAEKPVKNVWLIGSYARGDADDKSDVDVMVEIDYDKLESGFDYFGWHQDLGEKMKKNVDVLSYKYIRKHFLELVKAEMDLIYAK